MMRQFTDSSESININTYKRLKLCVKLHSHQHLPMWFCHRRRVYHQCLRDGL